MSRKIVAVNDAAKKVVAKPKARKRRKSARLFATFDEGLSLREGIVVVDAQSADELTSKVNALLSQSKSWDGSRESSGAEYSLYDYYGGSGFPVHVPPTAYACVLRVQIWERAGAGLGDSKVGTRARN